MKDSNFLKGNNAKFFWQPMAHPAQSQSEAPVILTAGQGVHVVDIDGNKTLDAVGGLWNVNLGYSCQLVKDAIMAQLDSLPYYSTFRGTTNDAAIELSYLLKEFFAPDGLSRSFYTSGGSDSVEVALRLSRQYHQIRNEPSRTKFLSLKMGYHGTHMGGASVNGNARFRTSYEPLLPGCYHLPAPHTYRNPFNESEAAKLADLCAASIEDEIKFQGAQTIAAMIVEPILGAGGVVVPHKSFFPKVREICTRHGILLIADEVITAFGRTGAWTGSRLWNVKPDMATTAKAITNGYFPFGAVMVSDMVADVFENDKSDKASIASGYTYSGHPVGAAAAVACLEETKRLNVVENAKTRGDELHAGLQGLKDKYELIGDVRGGYGLMSALELVKDRKTKEPIDKNTIAKIAELTYKAGVMVRVSSTNIIMSPPLIIEKGDVEKILSALSEAFHSI